MPDLFVHPLAIEDLRGVCHAVQQAEEVEERISRRIFDEFEKAGTSGIRQVQGVQGFTLCCR